MLRDVGSGADLRKRLILGFLLSSHDMVTLVMHIKDPLGADRLQKNNLNCTLQERLVS